MDDWEKTLDELLNAESGLSTREIEFLEDIDQKMRGRLLSQAQKDWLNRIVDRVL